MKEFNYILIKIQRILKFDLNSLKFFNLLIDFYLIQFNLFSELNPLI
jgi:hypothetical protein